MKKERLILSLVIILAVSVVDSMSSEKPDTDTQQLSAKYMGCYVDSDTRDLDGLMKDFGNDCSIDICVLYCKQNNFTYAAVQYRFFIGL